MTTFNAPLAEAAAFSPRLTIVGANRRGDPCGRPGTAAA